MKIIKHQITMNELREMSQKMYVILVKAVVDIEQEIMAVDGELHADLEILLSEQGSKRENTWGINLYPDIQGEDWVEFDSMINLKPHLGNRTRGVESQEIKDKIIKVVEKLVKK
ncbi:MAG: hypothetical protein A3B04_01520 [Candidatus Portnoybacteria bacterium RIFCSPLOWO2_02_FULL_39_11]|uniref:Uncharacterized protein n=1 Tax=Candidatus Portnoybacteria bacterium RIFCSPLOWO2_02_FULL_39_11 TaxID=1802001 RepID=A0A1G2FS74_9BACT|nr:MAG: hypothetical protein A3B04_01520 [Candidatus Portnoybacteria bacterium RIFCSPLOWO2_02_FULL_39_11]